MTQLLRLAILLVFAAIGLRATDVCAASADSARAPKLARSSKSVAARNRTVSIEKLIEQLGSDQYFLRRQAEAALLEWGADAFDRLQQAETHDDLEIAASAHYILQQIRIEWTQPQDSADVQAIMHRYGDLSRAERLEKMDQLLSLADDEGLGALCRIARFETSPHLGRYAALKVMLAKSPPNRASKGVETIAAELGDSGRTPAQWLRTYAEQLAHPDRTLDRWLELIDTEVALLDENSSGTEAAFVFRLLALHLDLCRKNPQPDATFANLTRRTDLIFQHRDDFREFLASALQGMTHEEQREFLGPANLAAWLLQDSHRDTFGLAYAMNWLWENEQWPALAKIEDHYSDAIRQDRLLIYFSAAARWKQGRDELAEEFAERAYSLNADDAEDRVNIGDSIGEMGRHDWAEREWWRVVETFPVLDGNALQARSRLASLRLHDRGEDKRAAALMAEICDAVDADAKLKGEVMRDAGRRQWFRQYHSQREYFLACQAAAEGNHESQRTHLDAAYGFNPEDPDVLIAMYRSPGADDAYRRTTVSRIQGTANKVAAKIEQDPDNSDWYNQWAWLISNTQGDYAQAVKHSLRSLELDPNSPSYLDTLGRCYYAVGDLDNAVKSQREAVRRHPHMQVMRDQLQLFESTLAGREKK